MLSYKEPYLVRRFSWPMDTIHPVFFVGRALLPTYDYLNNRVLLSKALSCDRLPEEIWWPQQMFEGLYEV